MINTQNLRVSDVRQAGYNESCCYCTYHPNIVMCTLSKDSILPDNNQYIKIQQPNREIK